MIENKITSLWFGDRNKLDKAYKEWIKKVSAAPTSFNVITFLEIKDLLDRDKVQRFLQDYDKEIEESAKVIIDKK